MTAPRHRVMHLITLLELGGAQQNTLHCVRHHDRSMFEVGLIAGEGGRLDDDARAIADADIRLVPWLVHPIRPLRDLVAVLRLRALLRRERIDLVHTHSSKAGLLGRIAACLAGVPAIVHTAHGWSFNETQSAPKRGLYVALERLAARFTDRLIVVASGHRDLGLAAGIGTPDRYRVVRSGIDVAHFARRREGRDDLRRSLGVGEGEFLVGTVACMKPQKAPLDFVDAAAATAAIEPRARFVMAGDGELMPAVRERIREHGLDDRVRLLGWREDVPELLQAMDVFLLTSRFEGLPRAVLQAMAAGTPTVATAVDGTPEVIEDGRTGCLVAAGDPGDMARAVAGLLADPERRRRVVRAAASRLDDEFDIDAMVRRLDALYAEILAERRVPAAVRPLSAIG